MQRLEAGRRQLGPAESCTWRSCSASCT